jgi:SOS response regulatory protein OraA/RecX
MRRELSEGQVRSRLLERGFNHGAADAALDQLRKEHALDDRRAATAVARTEARVRRHGRRRVWAKLAAMQIERGLAREVVNEVFGEDDETGLLEAALERRLRGRPERLKDPRERRKLQAYLVRQGFPASAAHAAIRRRMKP